MYGQKKLVKIVSNEAGLSNNKEIWYKDIVGAILPVQECECPDNQDKYKLGHSGNKIYKSDCVDIAFKSIEYFKTTQMETYLYHV